jgi:hypothetical protein
MPGSTWSLRTSSGRWRRQGAGSVGGGRLRSLRRRGRGGCVAVHRSRTTSSRCIAISSSRTPVRRTSAKTVGHGATRRPRVVPTRRAVAGLANGRRTRRPPSIGRRPTSSAIRCSFSHGPRTDHDVVDADSRLERGEQLRAKCTSDSPRHRVTVPRGTERSDLRLRLLPQDAAAKLRRRPQRLVRDAIPLQQAIGRGQPSRRVLAPSGRRLKKAFFTEEFQGAGTRPRRQAGGVFRRDDGRLGSCEERFGHHQPGGSPPCGPLDFGVGTAATRDHQARQGNLPRPRLVDPSDVRSRGHRARSRRHTPRDED